MISLQKASFSGFYGALYLVAMILPAFQGRGSAQDMESQDMVRLMRENNQWLERFSADCRIQQSSSVFTDMVGEISYIIHKDGDQRLKWAGTVDYRDRESGENYLFHGKTNKSGRLQIVMNPTQAAEDGVLYEEQPDTPDTSHMYAHLNGIARLAALGRQTKFGGPLLDSLGGITRLGLGELLESTDLTVERATEDGLGLFILRGDSSYGNVEVSLSPSEGFAVRSLRVEKLKDQHLDYDDSDFSITVLDSPVLRQALEFHAASIVEVDGKFIVNEAKCTESIETEDGYVATSSYKSSLKNIDLSPDFSAEDTFAFSVADGTKVFKILKDGRSVVSGLAWHNSQIDMDINKNIIGNIRSIVAEQRSDTAPKIVYDPGASSAQNLLVNTAKSLPGSVNPTMLRESTMVVAGGGILLVLLVLFRKRSGRSPKSSDGS